MVELAVLNVLVAAEVKTFIFLYPNLEKWEIWDRTRAMTQKLHFFIYTADGDSFFWCYSSNILFYGTKSYPESTGGKSLGLHFPFQVVAFYDPLGKTAQLDCGSTYGKRQNQDRDLFLIALISLGEERQCQGLGDNRERTDRGWSTTSPSPIASTCSENDQKVK